LAEVLDGADGLATPVDDGPGRTDEGPALPGVAEQAQTGRARRSGAIDDTAVNVRRVTDRSTRARPTNW